MPALKPAQQLIYLIYLIRRNPKAVPEAVVPVPLQSPEVVEVERREQPQREWPKKEDNRANRLDYVRLAGIAVQMNQK